MEFRLRTRQQGFTLIGLMVGQVVSLLVILAMLGLFRVITHNVFDQDTGMQPRANQDRQIGSALLTAQNALQGAGFGIGTPTINTHFILVDGAALSATSGTGTLQTAGTLQAIGTAGATGNAVFWESNPSQNAASGAWSCQGMVSDQISGALYWVQAAGGCDPLATSWASQKWTATPMVGLKILSAAVRFTGTAVKNSPCWPYGAEIPAATLTGQISAENGISNASQNTAGLQIQLNWTTLHGTGGNWLSCLPNFTS